MAAALALLLSLFALALPPEFGGYNGWGDAGLAVHNLVAILTRVVVFALAGGTLGYLWTRRRRTRR